jgi:hypothetical protein
MQHCLSQIPVRTGMSQLLSRHQTDGLSVLRLLYNLTLALARAHVSFFIAKPGPHAIAVLTGCNVERLRPDNRKPAGSYVFKCLLAIYHFYSASVACLPPDAWLPRLCSKGSRLCCCSLFPCGVVKPTPCF